MHVFGARETETTRRQRLCIEVIETNGVSRVMVAGTANKNKIGMGNKVKKLGALLSGLEKDAPAGK